MGRRDRKRSRSRSRSRSRDRRPRREPPKAAPAPERVDYAKLAESVKVSTSADGEVSMTVDDTNALRAKLGLKPLNAEVSSAAAKAREQAERNFELARAERLEARRLADIEAELAKAKRRREASAKLPESTLGDQVDDAAAWVQRQRKQKEDPQLVALEAERRRRLQLDQERAYTSNDLEGLNVAAHSAEALKVGDEMILTLEDEHILERNEHGKLVGLKKESQHTLQNVNRAEDDKIRRKRVELQEEQALHMGGDVADDFEYATGTSAATGVMAKYDDRTKQAHKLKIGSSGGLSAQNQSHLSGADIAALAQRMGKAPNAKMDTNDTSTLRTGRWGGVDASSASFETQNDYLTKDEARKLFRKKEKKARKASRKALPSTGSILDGLEEVDGERGSRSRKVHEDDGDDRRRRANWAAAQKTAQSNLSSGLGASVEAPKSTAQAARAIPDAPVTEQESSQKYVSGLGEDEDDAELRAALDRARRLKSEKPTGEAGAAALASRIKEEVPEDTAEPTDALVFTSTTEFTARLRARLEERAQAKEEKTSEDVVMEEAPPSDDESVEAAEAEARGELVDFLHKQPLARDGMAATMGLLRQTGDVQTQHVEASIGRARDRRDFKSDGTSTEDMAEAQRLAAQNADIAFKPIKLEYRDADGKLLTRKEAFRQMCHKFHGKGPGKKKTEKFAAREAERQRSIKMSAGAGSLSILQHAQQRTGQAYVPINNQQTYVDMGSTSSKKKSKKKEKKLKLKKSG